MLVVVSAIVIVSSRVLTRLRKFFGVYCLDSLINISWRLHLLRERELEAASLIQVDLEHLFILLR